MSDDIVKELRESKIALHSTAHKAADEIEKLREELDAYDEKTKELCDEITHLHADLAAVTEERDSAVKAAYEDAARFIEENVFNYGSDDQYWSPRKGGNTDGLEYAKEFRARAAIEGVKEPANTQTGER